MRSSKISRLDAARVALLKCRGIHQSAIAKRLRLGEATVSRLLSKEGEGEAYKYIKPPEFDWSMLTESEKAEIRTLDDVEGLSPIVTDCLLAIRRRLPARLNATVILARGDTAEAAPERNSLPSDFYEGAARAVWQLLTPASVIGIAWGETLSLLLKAVGNARLPVRYTGEQQPTIIPLCGESLGATRFSALSSSVLTQGFGEVLTSGTAEGYWSLSMIPVFLPGPKAFRDEEVKAVKKLLGFSAAYRKIFGAEDGSEPPLANQLDIVITSISKENRAFGVGNPDFTWETLKLRQFAELLIGDLGGIPLPRSGASSKALNALQERWTGLLEHHLRSCVERASAAAGPAGVIVVGAGRERAACIIEAVRRGLVNHLIVDEELGRALIDRLQ
jgi:DNA-binding transcriptional regulator LsrR (DeoR family)